MSSHTGSSSIYLHRQAYSVDIVLGRPLIKQTSFSPLKHSLYPLEDSSLVHILDCVFLKKMKNCIVIFVAPEMSGTDINRNIPIVKVPNIYAGVQCEEEKQRQKTQHAMFRRLFMDIEREQVKENIRRKEHRKRIQRSLILSLHSFHVCLDLMNILPSVALDYCH